MLGEEPKKRTLVKRVIIGQPDVKLSSFEHALQQAMACIAASARKQYRRGYFKNGLRTFHFTWEMVEPAEEEA